MFFYFFYFILFVLLYMLSCLFVVFFKQKTAYDMRISDWISDVCSSDLVRSLESLTAQFPSRQIEVLQGDANDRLVDFCDRILRGRLDRAVIFLDPFGLSVRWDTIERIAATKKVDLWYLVPVDGMSRQIKEDGSFLPGAAKIDELWGSSAWRTKAVRRADSSDDLFGGVDERLEKIAKAKQFSEMFRDHLQDVFAGGVAKTYLPLGRGRRHDFSLMFACANRSEEHTSELQSLMRISYAVFCLKKKKKNINMTNKYKRYIQTTHYVASQTID